MSDTESIVYSLNAHCVFPAPNRLLVAVEQAMLHEVTSVNIEHQQLSVLQREICRLIT